jgi:hypothetical protein
MIYIIVPGLCITIVLVWYSLDALLCKEDFVTNKYTLKKVAECINIYFPEKNIFYDLGSSRGGFCLELIEKCPQLQITGVDNSLIRILISKIRAFIESKKIRFTQQNIFKTDVSKAEIIYIYIPRILLPELAIKLEKEMSKDSIVITSRIIFLNWKPNLVVPKNIEGEEDIFIYKFPFLKAK